MMIKYIYLKIHYFGSDVTVTSNYGYQMNEEE